MKTAPTTLWAALLWIGVMNTTATADEFHAEAERTVHRRR